MGIRYAFSRPTAGTAEEEALIHGYQAAGYDGLQLKWNQYMPHVEEPERFIERWGQRPGLASALITGGTLLSDESKEELRRIFRFGKQVGTELIVYCHSVPRTGLDKAAIAGFARLFAELGKEAQSSGLKLSLHHHYDQPVMHRADFDTFFSELRPEDGVGLTVDTAHLVKSGITDVAEVIRSFAPFINNFHMKDFAAGEYRILGEGSIDFQPIMTEVQRIGYVGWMSADEESGGEIVMGMQQCLPFMKSGMGRVAE